MQIDIESTGKDAYPFCIVYPQRRDLPPLRAQPWGSPGLMPDAMLKKGGRRGAGLAGCSRSCRCVCAPGKGEPGCGKVDHKDKEVDARISGPGMITLEFSEDVVLADNIATPADLFSNLMLLPGGDRNIDDVEVSGNTITITFDGAPVPTDATATMDIGSGIASTAGSVLAETDDVAVRDGQAPVLDSVSVMSSNAQTGTAVMGDTVTLTFAASESLSLPAVTIHGSDVTPINEEGNTWSAGTTIRSFDSQGTVLFTIVFSDTAGNAGMPVTATTDGSQVVVRDALMGASITGTVFTDLDGNGVRDGSEPGYPGYAMYALDLQDAAVVLTAVTDQDGSYAFENVRPAPDVMLVQTGFFPPGHTVSDVASSWFSYVSPAGGQTETFDVGFYPVPEDERTTLNLTMFLDENRNGMMDAGEGRVAGVSFVVYTYTIGPEIVTTGADGTVTKTDLVPADWAITDLPGDYLVTVYDYQRDDSMAGKNYDSTLLLADEPEPGSVHTMVIGLVPAP